MPQRPTRPHPSHTPHLPLTSALTFGVELEFLIAAIPLTYPEDIIPRNRTQKLPQNPFPNDPRRVSGILDYPHPDFTPNPNSLTFISERRDNEYGAYTTCIADSLTEIGVPASPFYRFPPHVKDDIADASGVRQTWEVKRDSSVYVRWDDSDPENFFKWQSVELASPVLYSVESAFEEVRKVCHHLTTRYRVLANSSCGLHIHVGNCSAGYDVGMLKRLLASLWTCEPQIHILHPWDRTSTTGGAGFAVPLRYRGRERQHRPDIEGADVEDLTNWKALSVVYKCATKEDLIYWLSNPVGYNAYKMENLLPVIQKNVQTEAEAAEQLISSKRTIEFRQHEGTLDAKRIVNWAKVAIGFIDKARWRDPDHALRKVLNQLEVEDKHPDDAWGRGLEEMLMDVGGKEVEEFYLNWLGKEQEWMQIQLAMRQKEAVSEEKPRERHTEQEKEQIFTSAIAELRILDKELAGMEAQYLLDMDSKLSELDEAIVEVEEDNRGRRRDPKPCTATTDLSRGSSTAKMKLLSRVAGDRISGFRSKGAKWKEGDEFNRAR